MGRRYYEEIMFLLYFNDLNIITIKFLTHIAVPVAPLLRVQSSTLKRMHDRCVPNYILASLLPS